MKPLPSYGVIRTTVYNGRKKFFLLTPCLSNVLGGSSVVIVHLLKPRTRKRYVSKYDDGSILLLLTTHTKTKTTGFYRRSVCSCLRLLWSSLILLWVPVTLSHALETIGVFGRSTHKSLQRLQVSWTVRPPRTRTVLGSYSLSRLTRVNRGLRISGHPRSRGFRDLVFRIPKQVLSRTPEVWSSYYWTTGIPTPTTILNLPGEQCTEPKFNMDVSSTWRKQI